MNTRQFIEKHISRIKKARILICKNGYSSTHASVVARQDCIYSYGLHYPLLWEVRTPRGNRYTVCNKLGYSNSTSKHIGKCWGLSDIRVNLLGGTDYVNVLRCLHLEVGQCEAALKAKKRTNTAVYRMLEAQLEMAKSNLAKLI